MDRREKEKPLLAVEVGAVLSGSPPLPTQGLLQLSCPVLSCPVYASPHLSTQGLFKLDHCFLPLKNAEEGGGRSWLVSASSGQSSIRTIQQLLGIPWHRDIWIGACRYLLHVNPASQ